MDDKPDLNTSALNTLVLNTFDLNTSVINTPDQVTTEIDTTDLGTMDSESDLDSIGLPNTKPALIYRLTDPILEILGKPPSFHVAWTTSQLSHVFKTNSIQSKPLCKERCSESGFGVTRFAPWTPRQSMDRVSG